ncbi:MAG: 4Fe-4S dicluster domain-containing protein [Candidatus Polarisedimenticolaceae bacterium]|nr:4Fe-4S dicluster domain-containing protein [Candidatus Polarisedimenticolaceae bacterium]
MTKCTEDNKPIMVGDRTIPPPDARYITISIMGQPYEVPETLTILKAMEFVGYQFKRGCGCRGGICGACGTFYRIEGEHTLKTGLACQTVVEPGMILAQIPFFPSNRAAGLDLETRMPADQQIATMYPEIFRCVGCGTCTRTCPMGIDVMGYIAHFKRGDIMGGAEQSFDCIMCGLCAARCPANISQFNVAMTARRIASVKLTPKSEVTAARAEKVRAGRYEPMLAELCEMSKDELKKLYVEREREPDLAKPGEWMPEDQTHL